MAIKNRTSASAINIRVHPHSPETYLSLLRAAFAQKKPVTVYGEQQLLLNTLNYRKSEEIVVGTIAKFTEIDLDQPWFNTETNDAADNEILSQVKIPLHLKPNFSAFQYTLHLKKHLIVIETYSDGKKLSPRFALKLLSELFSEPKLLAKFGPVDLTIEPEANKLNQILKMPILQRLELYIERPNPDDFEDAEEDFLETLNEQNAGKIQILLSAADSKKSLKPDSKTIVLAKIAARNGKVEAQGKDAQGKPLKESTVDHPKTLSKYFDPDIMGATVAFQQLVKEFIQDLIPIKRHD